MIVLITIFTGCKTTGSSKHSDGIVNPWIGDDGNYYHTPKKGEWGAKIADMYGLSSEEISSYNDNRNWMDGRPIKVSDIEGKFPRPRRVIWADESRIKGEAMLKEYELKWQAITEENQALLKDSKFLISRQNKIDRVTSEYKELRMSFREYVDGISAENYKSYTSNSRSSSDLGAVVVKGSPLYMKVSEYDMIFFAYLLESEKAKKDLDRFNRIKKYFKPLEGKPPAWINGTVLKKLKKYSLHNGMPGSHAERITELRACRKSLDEAVWKYQVTSDSLELSLKQFDGTSFQHVFVADYHHQESYRILENVALGKASALVVDYEEFLVANGLEELVVSSQ